MNVQSSSSCVRVCMRASGTPLILYKFPQSLSAVSCQEPLLPAELWPRIPTPSYTTKSPSFLSFPHLLSFFHSHTPFFKGSFSPWTSYCTALSLLLTFFLLSHHSLISNLCSLHTSLVLFILLFHPAEKSRMNSQAGLDWLVWLLV